MEVDAGWQGRGEGQAGRRHRSFQHLPLLSMFLDSTRSISST